VLTKITGLYRQSYSGLSRETWLLSAVMLINRAGTMVLPFISLYMTKALGYTLKHAGIVISLFGVGAVCGGFIGGRLSGKFGFRNVQLFALAAGGVLFVCFGFLHNFYAICAGAFVLSTINESFRPANSLAIAAYCSPGTETRSYSLNRLAINVGWALGGTMGGLVAGYNYNLLFWIDGFTNISAATMLFLLLRPAVNASAVQKEPVAAIRNAAFRDRSYLFFSLFTTMYAMCIFQIFSTVPVYFSEKLGMSEKLIGLTMAVNGVMIVALEMLLVFRLEGKRNPLYLISIGTLLVALSYAVFNFGGSWMIQATLNTLVITLAEMLSMPFMNTYWVGRSSDATRSSYAGLYTVSWAAAQVLGPALGTRVAFYYGYPTLWWSVAGLAVLSAAGYWWLMYRDKALAAAGKAPLR
jgi:predicted MFS family arabinose efflux permease